MKSWLVTLRKEARLADFDREAAALHCHRPPEDAPIPLDDGNIVVRVVGPEASGIPLGKIPLVDDVHPDEALGLM